MGGLASGLEKIRTWIVGWRFAAFAFGILVGIQLFFLLMLLVPESSGPLAEFARDFRATCFAQDPQTGEIKWIYLLMGLTNPFWLQVVILLAWWGPIKELRQLGYSNGVPALASGIGTVVLALAGLLMVNPDPSPADPRVFPAQSLRTQLRPPAFRLTDQEGRLLDSNDLSGRVVLVTSVYASCGATCPLIINQLKQTVAALTPAQREAITVVAITMDPEKDTPEVLKGLAGLHQLDAGQYRLLTGDPAEVNRILDGFNVYRERDPVNGIIDHDNLFMLIDRDGKLAYRFSLGEGQRDWLVQAIVRLVAEPPPGA